MKRAENDVHFYGYIDEKLQRLIHPEAGVLKASRSTDVTNLPLQFVNSMKTLFNLLDDRDVGKVSLAEIERRWREDAVPNLPGVLDALRDTTPPDGLLSFETFVRGLRLALFRSRKTEFFNGDNVRGYKCIMNGTRSLPRKHQTVRNYQKDDPFHRCDTSEKCSQSIRRPLRHRRSNSGPICTTQMESRISGSQDVMKAKELSRASTFSHNERLEIQTKSSRLHENQCDLSNKKLNVISSQSQNTLTNNSENKNNFNKISASTFHIQGHEKPGISHLQPVVLSGKYIGITGTLEHTKSAASSRRWQSSAFSNVATTSQKLISVSFNELVAQETYPSFSNIKKQPAKSCSNNGIIERPAIRRDHYGRRCSSSSPRRSPRLKALSKNCYDRKEITKIRQETASSSSSFSDESFESLSQSKAAFGGVNTLASPDYSEEKIRFSKKVRGRSRRDRDKLTNSDVFMFTRSGLKNQNDLLRDCLDTLKSTKTIFEYQLRKIQTCQAELQNKFPSNYELQKKGHWEQKQVRQTEKIAEEIVSSLSRIVCAVSENEYCEVSNDYVRQFKAKMRNRDEVLEKEVSDKTAMIAQLESEKSMLVRQLFHARADLKSSRNQIDTSIFI